MVTSSNSNGAVSDGALVALRKGLAGLRGTYAPKEEAPYILAMAETGKPAYKGLGATSSPQHSRHLIVKDDLSDRVNGEHLPEWMNLKIGGAFSDNVIESPIPFYVAGMSFGSLGLQHKIAIHLAANMLYEQYGINLIVNTGEGGALPWELFGRDEHWNKLSPAERDKLYAFSAELLDFYKIGFDSQSKRDEFIESLFHRNYSLIVQRASGGFFSTPEYLKHADGIEIKIGQGAKIGHGGLLPGEKVNAYVAAVRGITKGKDARSPARILSILGPEDLVHDVEDLREATDWKPPIIVKYGASRVYYDTRIGLKSLADAVAIDGLTGGTGAAPVKVQNVIGINTEPAIVEGRRAIDDYFRENGEDPNFSFLVSGGLRDYERIFKAIALGKGRVSGVGLGTSFLQAGGCTLVMTCNTNTCPTALTGLPEKYTIDKNGLYRFFVEGEELTLTQIIERNVAQIVNYVVATAKMLGSMKSSAPTLDDLVTDNAFVSAFSALPLVDKGITYRERVARAARELAVNLG